MGCEIKGIMYSSVYQMCLHPKEINITEWLNINICCALTVKASITYGV